MTTLEPPDGYVMAQTWTDVQDADNTARRNSRAGERFGLQVRVRGTWTAARMSATGQPTNTPRGVPSGRRRVAVTWGEGIHQEDRRFPVEQIAVPARHRAGGCPDGGQCYRWCGTGACTRVLTCVPLSAAGYPGDRWPDDIVARERAAAGLPLVSTHEPEDDELDHAPETEQLRQQIGQAASALVRPTPVPVTDEPGGRYERMSYLDVSGRNGPVWEHWQAARERDRIIADYDEVPPWFLRDVARKRVAEARVSCQFLDPRGRVDEIREVFNALRVVEQYLDGTRSDRGHDVQEHVIAALLGAREEQDRRERADGFR